MVFKTSAIFLMATLALTCAAIAQEEEFNDERGIWVADINPTTKDMFVTDCPCEDSGNAIEMTCKAKSGMVHVEIKDFLTDKAKAGDAAPLSLAVDGGAVMAREGKMAAYTDGFVMPALDIAIDDPIFAAIAAGGKLAVTHGGQTITSPLKGSKKAMAEMLEYCGK